MSMIITAPTPQADDEIIESDSFWPDVSTAAIREQHRIDNTVTPSRLRIVLFESIASTNEALAEWRAEREAEGNATLVSVPAAKVDNTSVNVHRYFRAVGCLAKAMLLERYLDFDATGKGDKRAEQIADPIDDHRRDHLHAISDIVGRLRTTVELV